jgi:ABC-type multidrug transport system permease subunit
MRQILSIARKELQLWAQKPVSWFIVFVLPFLFIWYGHALSGVTADAPVVVYAVNEDQGTSGARVIRALRASAHLRMEMLNTREEADQRVGSGERVAAVLVAPDFSERLQSGAGAAVEIMIDPNQLEMGSMVNGLVRAALNPLSVDAAVDRKMTASVNRIIQRISGEVGAPVFTPSPPAGTADDEDPFSQFNPTPTPEPGQSPVGDDDSPFDSGSTDTDDSAGAPVDDETVTEPPVPAPASDVDMDTLRTFLTTAADSVVSNQVQEAVENPQVQMQIIAFEGQNASRPALLENLVPGYSLLFVFFLAANLAAALVVERNAGILRRLLAAPIPRSRVFIGKMLAFFLLAAIQISLIFIISSMAFGISLGQSPAALAVMIICSALIVACLGILVAAFARSETQSYGIAILVILIMAVIGGNLFPGMHIPGISAISPHYWAMQGFQNVITLGQGIEGVILPAAILVILSAVSFTIGAVRFRFDELP